MKTIADITCPIFVVSLFICCKSFSNIQIRYLVKNIYLNPILLFEIEIILFTKYYLYLIVRNGPLSLDAEYK